jgi:hypothetical protein
MIPIAARFDCALLLLSVALCFRRGFYFVTYFAVATFSARS